MTLFNILRIARSNNIGPVGFKYLLSKYGNDAIEHIKEINLKWKGREIVLPPEDDIKREMDLVHNSGAFFVTICDENYPSYLKKCIDAPPVLTCDGDDELLLRPTISIVGMRNASANGILFTKNLMFGLSNFVICSGLAAGIDTAAHKYSYPNTIAVLPCGINVCYPNENLALFEKIKNNGLLISDAPYDTKPKKSLFPSRNKIIAGISPITCVIESGASSGALITANMAKEYNREVFAVPGHPFDERYIGNNGILQSFAKVLLSSDDIVSAYYSKSLLKEDVITQDTLSEYDKKSIYNFLSYNTIHINDIISHFNISINELLYALSELEILGKIKIENMNVCKIIEDNN